MIPSLCAPPAVSGLATQLLADTDCRAFGLVERGYAALSQPDGIVGSALTGLLVIAVALFGYRLLLGRGLLLSDAVGLAIKIGIVLLIATSWSSWQTVAYDSLARAPTRIAADLLGGIDARDPLASLQSALDDMETASLGYRTRAGIASPLVGGPAATAMTLNISAMILTLSIIGLLVIARVILALMLAIAPVMAGFILFDATRGMAAGWLTAMVTAALTPMFVLVLAAIEFAVLTPLISRVLAEQGSGQFNPQTVTPVGLVSLVFGMAMLAAVWAGATIARGIKLPFGYSRNRQAVATTDSVIRQQDAAQTSPSSAITIAQALDRAARRDARQGSTGARGVASALATSSRRPAQSHGSASNPDYASPQQRATLPRAPRRSRAASRRDR